MTKDDADSSEEEESVIEINKNGSKFNQTNLKLSNLEDCLKNPTNCFGHFFDIANSNVVMMNNNKTLSMNITVNYLNETLVINLNKNITSPKIKDRKSVV